MTPEEAIAVFDKMLKRYAWAEDNKSVQAIKVAKKCIEKQIEKKPISTFDNHNHFCPACHHPIKLSRKYCGSCGQKTGYGSEEE